MFVAALKSSPEAIFAMEKEKIELNHARLEQEVKKDDLDREQSGNES